MQYNFTYLNTRNLFTEFGENSCSFLFLNDLWIAIPELRMLSNIAVVNRSEYTLIFLIIYFLFAYIYSLETLENSLINIIMQMTYKLVRKMQYFRNLHWSEVVKINTRSRFWRNISIHVRTNYLQYILVRMNQ